MDFRLDSRLDLALAGFGLISVGFRLDFDLDLISVGFGLILVGFGWISV